MNDSETREAKGSGHRRRLTRRHGWWAGLTAGGVLGVLLTAGVVAALQVQAGGFGHGHGGWGHRDDPERMAERVAFKAEWLLRGLDATEEQQARVQEIVKSTVRDLTGLRAQHHENRRAIMEELSAAEFDPDAVERIRVSEVQLADAASVMLMQAVVEVADVLTPEQRREVSQMMQRFHPGPQ